MTVRQYAKPRDKEVADLFKQAAQRGWAVTGGGKRHYRMECPNPCLCAVTVSGNSSTNSRRALANNDAHLRNHTCWNGAKR